jgi:hypothetical protein
MNSLTSLESFERSSSRTYIMWPRAVISVDDPLLRDARAGERIFGAEEGRGEIEIALADEHPKPGILAHRLADIGA